MTNNTIHHVIVHRDEKDVPCHQQNCVVKLRNGDIEKALYTGEEWILLLQNVVIRPEVVAWFSIEDIFRESDIFSAKMHSVKQEETT